MHHVINEQNSGYVPPKEPEKPQEDPYNGDLAAKRYFETYDPLTEPHPELENAKVNDYGIKDHAKMEAELAKRYIVRFSYSSLSKRLAIEKDMSLEEIYHNFNTNISVFIGLTKMEDYAHIEEFSLNDGFLYQMVRPDEDTMKRFLSKLKADTEFTLFKWPREPELK